MNYSKHLPLLALIIVILSASNLCASTIDFETVPGSSPADKLAISNQYEALFGVTFSTSGGGTPYLEQAGDSDDWQGFVNDKLGNKDDVAASGYESQLGNYFLRLGTGDLASTPVPTLIIDYTNPVAAASAQIWDIDRHSNGFEQWIIKAFDATGTLVDSITSPVGLPALDTASLDGKPWTWSFDHGATSDIYSIEVVFNQIAGAKTSGIGLAFDNFSPSSAAPVPEPATMLLLGTGLVGLAGARRKFKK